MFGSQLSDLGIRRDACGFYLAFELSCHNLISAWRRLYLEQGWYETMEYDWTPWRKQKGRPSKLDRLGPRQLRLPLRLAPAPARQWVMGKPSGLVELRFRGVPESALRWAKGPDGGVRDFGQEGGASLCGH